MAELDLSRADSAARPFPGTPPDAARLGPAFKTLCEVVAKLRSPEGCPWDRQQTLESIKRYTLEETYELLDAIDSGDDTAIVEELGDLLLQVLLDAQIGTDAGRFGLIDVVETLTAKMIHRHPHVFGDAVAETAGDVAVHWSRAKQSEKQRASVLEGIPIDLPQLARAYRISARAAEVGYDFPLREMLFDKLREELAELQAELYPDGAPPDVPASVDVDVVTDEPVCDPDRRDRIESELGDVLFVMANIARRWKIAPEEALRRSNRKFAGRFRYIESRLAKQGRTVRDATLKEMEKLYQQGKRTEADSSSTSAESTSAESASTESTSTG